MPLLVLPAASSPWCLVKAMSISIWYGKITWARSLTFKFGSTPFSCRYLISLISAEGSMTTPLPITLKG